MTTIQSNSPIELVGDAMTEMGKAVTAFRYSLIEDGWSEAAAEDASLHLLKNLITKAFVS